MSRNEERLRGIPSDVIPQSFNQATPQLELPNQTEFVDLPSRGLFYPEDHPLFNQETVEIKFMTAKEEDILTNKSYVQKGVVIDKFLKSMLVDKRINPDSLLIADRNAILIAARVTGYSNEYVVNIPCPLCYKSSKTTFDLTLVNNRISTSDDHDVWKCHPTSKGTYIAELEKTKAKVEFKVLTAADEKKIEASAENKKKLNLPEASSTDLLKTMIVSVNDNEDKVFINHFIENMPALDSRLLRKIYSEITPKVDMSFDYYCTNCNETSVVEVPLTSEFFWPK